MKHKYILPPQPIAGPSSEINSAQNTQTFIYPPFFRLTTSYFPKSDGDNSKRFPIGVSIIPGMLDNVPTIDYRNKYVVHCPVCHGYLSANCVIVPERKAWICALCGNLTTLPKDYDINTGIETHSAVYDMIINNQSTLPGKEEKNFLKMFSISIDTSNPNFCQIFGISLKKVLYQIQDESIVICLFSSGQNITYYDPGRQKAFIISDFDNFQLPPFQYLPFSQTKSFIFKSIDNIINLSKNSSNTDSIHTASNFRNTIKIGQKFMKEFGGIFIISLFGLPSDVNTANNDKNPYIIPNDQSDILDFGFSLNASSISVHIFHHYDTANSTNQSVVTDAVAGLTSGSSYDITANYYPITSDLVYKQSQDTADTESMPDDLILQSQLQKILNSKYFWRSLCVLRSHPEISRSSYLSNCVIRKNGVCTLGAFPKNASTSISFELSFPKNKMVLNRLDRIGIQFAMMFINDEGQQMNRIISYLVDIGDDCSKIVDKNRVDVQAVTAIVSKIAVKIIRDSDYESMINFIRKNEMFCLSNIFGRLSSISEKNAVFLYGASINELLLFLLPRVVERSKAVWKQTNLAVFVVPNKGLEDEVKSLIFGENENPEKNDFVKFYEECKSFIGWSQPIIFLV